MRADGGRQRVGDRALARILVLLMAMWAQPCAWPAQEPLEGTLPPESPAGGPAADGAGAEDPPASRGPGLIRVPPPSGQLSRRGPGAFSPTDADRDPGQASSRGWWLGSTGIALVLAVCGAVCVAARRYRPQDSAGIVRVVGRVSLTPRHSIFVVRAGGRSLLIGTGTQGAPTLLGELTGADQAEPDRVRPARPETRGVRSREGWDQGTLPVVDIRLEEEE